MNWKYYIPHEWSEGEMNTWEDIFILSDDSSYTGDALSITIDCAVSEPDDRSDEEWCELYEKQQHALAGANYCIVSEPNNMGANMIVAQYSFSIDDILAFVKIWIAAQELPVTEILPVPIEQFTGRCSHADLIYSLQHV
ncbi:MAG: hypothetical protein V3V22_07760 [Methylococcales bacterium]